MFCNPRWIPKPGEPPNIGLVALNAANLEPKNITKDITMKSRIFSTLAVCTALTLPAAGAMASDENVEITEEVTQSIQTKLTAQGYEVGKIKVEDGLYEAYAKKDGQRFEVFLNAALEIVRTEIDD